jgi:hypothetical protein
MPRHHVALGAAPAGPGADARVLLIGRFLQPLVPGFTP